MICFSVCLLLMSRKDTDLCELILYPTSLLNLFTVSRHFLIQFLGALMHHLMSPANRDSLSSSFPICDPLTSFFYLLAPDTTLNTMLKVSKDRGQPCAITDCFKFFFIHDDMCVSHLQCLWYWGVFLLWLLSWRHVGFWQRLFINILGWSCDLSLNLLMWLIPCVNFHTLNHACISGIKPVWSWYVFFKMYVFILFVNILLNIWIYVHQGYWSVEFLSNWYLNFNSLIL